MAAVNDGLRIYQEDAFTFARDEAGLVNVAAIQAMARPPQVSDFLSQPATIEQIHDIAANSGRPLPAQWRDAQYVRSQGADFFRALTAARIAHRVPGSVGRRANMVQAGGCGVGEVDFRPGVWLHADLVLPLVEWMTHRNSPTEKKPIVEFVKRAISRAGIKSQKKSGPKSAAELFAAEAAGALLKTLQAADESMIEAGETFEDRRDALTSLLKTVRGSRK